MKLSDLEQVSYLSGFQCFIFLFHKMEMMIVSDPWINMCKATGKDQAWFFTCSFILYEYV